MPVIEIPQQVFTILEKDLGTGTKINPTQIIRAALLQLKKSHPSIDEIYSLIGKSSTDEILINSLEVSE